METAFEMSLLKQPFPGSVFKKAIVDVVSTKFRVTEEENAAPIKVSGPGKSVPVRRGMCYSQQWKSKHVRTSH